MICSLRIAKIIYYYRVHLFAVVRNGRREKNMTTENGTCVLCGRPITGWGNNPYPLAEDGECCDQCNGRVIQARLIRAIRAQGGAQ